VLHAACMRDVRNVYRILVRKPKRAKPLGRTKNRWEDGNKVYLKTAKSDIGNQINLNPNRANGGLCDSALNLRVL
jgi:hypothetical protein